MALAIVRSSLAAIAAALLLSCSAPQRPNLVLIIIDTLRADRLHSYGLPQPNSPELDALSQRGVRFARVIAPSSWTRPSVGSILTALHPRTIGIYDEPRDTLAGRFTTLPEILRDYGYTTLGSTANPNINAAYGFDQGFDEYRDSHVLWPWMPSEKDKQQGYEHPMRTSRETFDDLALLIARNPGRATYVQACIMDVHGAFSEGVVKPPFANRFPGTADHAYVEAVGQASFEIDRFIAKLSALPGWDNTLYVITSDHGQGLFDHPDVAESRLHGQLLYESHIAVPLILHHPASATAESDDAALPIGVVIERPVRLLDIAPTLLDFAAIPIPEEMAGVSLLPLLAGGDVALPPAFVVETEYRNRNKIGAYGRNYIYIANRAAHEGVGPRELQLARRRANGTRTDVSERLPRAAEKLAAYLERWESQHPKSAPTHLTKALSQEELDQLRALGYLP